MSEGPRQNGAVMKSRIQNHFTHETPGQHTATGPAELASRRSARVPQPATLKPTTRLLTSSPAIQPSTLNPLARQSEASAAQPVSAPSTLNSQPSTTYALRKGRGFWELTFAGQRTIFKHEQGAFYVAYLLAHPPEEPIHALDLATRVAAAHSKPAALDQIIDPTSGEVVTLSIDTRIQERGLGLDRAETMRAVLHEQKKLETILEDETTTQPVKEEIQRELVALYKYEEKNTARTRDSARRAVRAVNTAIKRLHRHLADTIDAEGRPHRVLRSFAAHLERYVLVASGRYAGAGRASARAGIAGCFTYQPPRGVVWRQ